MPALADQPEAAVRRLVGGRARADRCPPAARTAAVVDLESWRRAPAGRGVPRAEQLAVAQATWQAMIASLDVLHRVEREPPRPVVPPVERRGSERLRLDDAPVRVWTGERPLAARGVDVSASGVRVRLLRAAPTLGAAVALEVPGIGERIRGRVVRVTPEALGRIEVAVMFDADEHTRGLALRWRSQGRRAA